MGRREGLVEDIQGDIGATIMVYTVRQVLSCTRGEIISIYLQQSGVCTEMTL